MFDFSNLESYDKNEIEHILDKACHDYYNTKKEYLTDNEFDFLKTYLLSHYPDSKYNKNIGCEIVDGKVDLPVHMGSIDNLKDAKKIDNWVKKHKESDYVAMTKLDGISGLFVVDGMSKKLYTRGDGSQGRDISHLIKHLNIPDVSSYTNMIVRGELIIELEVYNKLNVKSANARSFVSGVINSKKYNKEHVKKIKFVAYELIHPLCKIEEQLKKINTIGFHVVKNTKLKALNLEVCQKTLIKFKADSIYLMDGLVIKHNFYYDVNTKGNPSYAFAFKMVLNEQIEKSKIVDIHWNPSKFGKLFPQIEIEPVVIAGNTIKFVSGKSGKYIYDNKLGPGAVISVIRTCDVIPDIHEIIKGCSKAYMPKGKYEWNETGVDVISLDENDKSTIDKKLIEDFFKTLKISNMGPGTINTLYENGYKSIKKVIGIKVEDLLKIKGFKEKSSQKIVNNIKDGINNITIIDLMNASNIFGKGFGVKNLTLLYEKIPNILELKGDRTLYDKIVNIKSFSDTKTKQFMDKLGTFKKYVNDLNIDTHNLKQFQTKKKENNNNVVLTGFRDEDLSKLLNKKKIDVNDDINNETLYVICKDIKKKTNKMINAEKKGVKVIEMNDFIENFKTYVK